MTRRSGPEAAPRTSPPNEVEHDGNTDIPKSLLTQLRDELTAINRLTESGRPLQRERVQYAVWRARKALKHIEWLVDEAWPQIEREIERALMSEADPAQ